MLLFIFYFIIDNAGYKMARDGKTEVWVGIWLSSFVLLPMGVFFTYKAVGDSAVFNIDAYKAFFQRLTGREPGRSLSVKKVIMNEIDPEEALRRLEAFHALAASENERLQKLPPLRRLLARGPDPQLQPMMNEIVEYLSDSHDRITVAMLNKYPFRVTRRRLSGIVANTENLSARVESHAREQ